MSGNRKRRASKIKQPTPAGQKKRAMRQVHVNEKQPTINELRRALHGPSSKRQAAILQLQRTVGNKTVHGLLVDAGVVQRVRSSQKGSSIPIKELHTFAHRMEKADPERREPQFLNICYKKWLKTNDGKNHDEKEPPPPKFFGYVDDLEQKDPPWLQQEVLDWLALKFSKPKDIFNRLRSSKRMKQKKWLPRITYLKQGTEFKKQSLRRWLVKFEGGKPFHFAPNGKMVELKYDCIYVMTPNLEFYAREETSASQLSFHHSSFLAGEAVGAAGHMKQIGNQLGIDRESGHYQPKLEHLVSAVNALEKKVDLDSVRVGPIARKGLKGPMFKGTDLIAGLRVLKNMPKKFEILLDLIKQKKKTLVKWLVRNHGGAGEDKEIAVIGRLAQDLKQANQDGEVQDVVL
jgi:hypothetical protein